MWYIIAKDLPLSIQFEPADAKKKIQAVLYDKISLQSSPSSSSAFPAISMEFTILGEIFAHMTIKTNHPLR